MNGIVKDVKDLAVPVIIIVALLQAIKPLRKMIYTDIPNRTDKYFGPSTPAA